MMNTPDIKRFEQFARDHASLAHAVCMAQAFAQCERERVAAYIEPLFLSYKFQGAKKWFPEGRALVKSKDAYLSDDEEGMALFFAEADELHRKHGFTGPKGHCPALRAEELQRIAERALLAPAAELFGVTESAFQLDNRKEFLNLVLGACLKARNERKSA